MKKTDEDGTMTWIKFCPKCGAMMEVIKEGNRAVLRCPSCGHLLELHMNKNLSFTESVEHPVSREMIVESEELQEIRRLPTARVECPKCGNNKAYWWFMQTRSLDEPETRFFRCTKCGYTWREYD